MKKIYIDTVGGVYYTNQFSDTTTGTYSVTVQEYEDLVNGLIIIDYGNTNPESGVAFIENPTPKENITSLYIKGGKLYMESVNNEYEIQGITIV